MATNIDAGEGIMLNRPGGRRAITVTQQALALSPRYHIAQADVAEAFVAASRGSLLKRNALGGHHGRRH